MPRELLDHLEIVGLEGKTISIVILKSLNIFEALDNHELVENLVERFEIVAHLNFNLVFHII